MSFESSNSKAIYIVAMKVSDTLQYVTFVNVCFKDESVNIFKYINVYLEIYYIHAIYLITLYE